MLQSGETPLLDGVYVVQPLCLAGMNSNTQFLPLRNKNCYEPKENTAYFFQPFLMPGNLVILQQNLPDIQNVNSHDKVDDTLFIQI